MKSDGCLMRLVQVILLLHAFVCSGMGIDSGDRNFLALVALNFVLVAAVEFAKSKGAR